MSTKGFKFSEESKQKMSETRTGNKNPHWNGGIKIHCGYILINMPNHPYCDSDNYVPEHRLIIEAQLGRYLTPKEVVHHINKNRADNRLENLILFANGGEHSLVARHVVRDSNGHFIGGHNGNKSNTMV